MADDDSPIYDLRKSVEKLKLETVQPISDTDTRDMLDDSLDLWEDDVTDNAFDHSSELDRDWNRRREEFRTAGYREGITAGKEASAQEGFNVGFKQSVHDGYNWGVVRGITSAFANLPDHLKEKLAGKLETKDRIRNLGDSVKSISTNDALMIYHAKIKHVKARKTCSGSDSHTEDPYCSQLDSLHNELISVLDTSPEINVTRNSE